MVAFWHQALYGPTGSGSKLAHGATTPPSLIQRRRGLVSDDAIPFSWIQCAISVFAYVWLLSNFIRTGIAIHGLDAFQTTEPDVHISFGPYAYPGNSYFKNGAEDLTNVTSADPVALWGYKFDTTSLAIRAFAEYLNASAFPACVLYNGKCDSDFLDPATGLTMLDALVDAVRDAIPLQGNTTAKLRTQDRSFHQLRPQKLLLRASHEYFDRIHHYLMSQLFTTPFWRTCEAVYYSPELLSLAASKGSAVSSDEGEQGTDALADLCSYAYSGVRPYFCDDLWTHFSRSCAATDTECRDIGRVSLHVMQRLEEFQASNPDSTVDLLIVESADDIDISRGGFTFVGKRGFDVVTIFRARTCSGGDTAETCDTQVLEDYRYEGETFTTDVLQWYPIVAALRGTAQTYYWIRVGMLFAGCYYAGTDASGALRSQTFHARLCQALRTFFKIPSQVIIYGSPLPLVCYLTAHMIDSPMVYELMAQKFDSFNGLFQLSVMELITVSSLQMRNVWVLANMVHIVVRLATKRRWSPTRGVWGMPQFSIALISSLTICSQFRFLSLRWTPVMAIQQTQVVSHLHPTIEALFHVNGGGGKASLGGVFLDVKAIMCSVAILSLCVMLLSWTTKVVCKKLVVHFVFLRAHSITPLSAGVLWSTTALAVCWSDDLFQVHETGHNAFKYPPAFSTKIQPSTHRPKFTPAEAKTLDDRSEAVEADMYLMNITMLSDPIAYLLWRWKSSRTRLGYYRSTKTQHVYLVPLVHSTSHDSELSWQNFTLEGTVAVSELTWREIIACG